MGGPGDSNRAQSGPTAPSGTRHPTVTPRALGLGALAVLAISLLSPWAVLMVQGSQLTSNAIPIIAVVLLLLLTAGVMPLLRLWQRAWALSRGELVTVYTMMLVGSVVVTTGFTGSFLSVITGAVYYATPENEWNELFLPHLSPWLTPTDSEAIRRFFEGAPQGMAVPWHAWWTPLCVWTLFVLLFYWVTLCVAVLLRGQWVNHERLVFPLTRLPLAMLEEDSERPSRLAPLFSRRLMWLGFAVPLLIHSWNSLHNYHEAFHPIPLDGSVVLLQGAASLLFRLNLPILGLAYLMSLNVAFSIWFFFLLAMAERLVFARLGLQIAGTGDIWTSGGAPPSIAHQGAGALVMLAVYALWAARGHLRYLAQLAWRGERDPDEALAPRTALVGLAIGLTGMVTWLAVTGMSAWVAVLLVAGALVVYIGLARIVCEAGLPGAQTPMVPQAFLARGLGPEVLGLRDMTCLGLSTTWMGETAANMMNALVHGLKLVSGEGLSSRRLPVAVFVAILIGLGGSIWTTMELAYAHGGINLHGWYYEGAARWPYDYMASVYNLPEASFLPRMEFTLVGAAAMALLLFFRQRFLWWPLHPIGLPIAQTFTIEYYAWLSILLAWLIKVAVLRYGGVRLYRRLLPFFLGLALGEFATATLWVFIDGYNGVQGNVIFNF